jgi:hypothetical protein
MIQAGDAVFHGIAGGQHQDGHALSGFAELAAHRETVRGGDHHVEDHQVVGVHRCLVQRILAGSGDIHGIGLFTQPFRHKPRDPWIIFH